jgi:chemotaxis protein MotB
MQIKLRLVLVAGSLLGSATLTSCVSQSSYDSLNAENAQLHNYIAAQRTELAQTRSALDQHRTELERSKGQTARLQGALKYTVESDLMFPSGSWKMSAEGKEIISKMAKKLAPSQENRLVVTGYTDDVPIGDQLEQKGIDSNTELSQKRAEAVKQFLIEQGVSPNLVIARGGGENKPVATNKTPEGRAQNRRVELSLGG